MTLRTASTRGMAAALVLSLAPLAGVEAAGAPAQPPRFDEVQARTKEFIGYSTSIKLTPKQKKSRDAALRSIPAPCCNEYSIATCCCPCNLAKTVWGLANFAIVRLGYDAPRVKTLVVDWLATTNPRGYTGNACHRGGCPRPFSANGCGGMKEEAVAF